MNLELSVFRHPLFVFFTLLQLFWCVDLPAEQGAPLKSESRTKKIVVIAGKKSHGPEGNGIHDYPWSAKLLKVLLEQSNVRDRVRVEVHFDGWPKAETTLDDADSIMVISDGRDGNLYAEAPHLESETHVALMERQMRRGCGFVNFHFSTFAPEALRDRALDWSGGYFQWETEGVRKWYSAIKVMDAPLSLPNPSHPLCRGVRPFQLKEEFYYNLRFSPTDKALSPILEVPALPGRDPDGRWVAWARERPDGGRGFGTSCGHFYDNWKNDDFRKLMLNALVWTAHVDVPEGGVESSFRERDEVTALLKAPDGRTVDHALDASANDESGLFRQQNLAAWCIVPFDRAKRNPEQRAAMLEKLGIRQFVYDYRAEHVPEWDEEMEALKRHHISLLGWWFPGSLSAEALKALDLFRRHNVKPQLWVTGGGGSVESGSVEEQQRRLVAEVRRLKPIAEAAKADGLSVGLYNHGGWFGEPDNQIAIIKALQAEGVSNVGIVYNQHHGHGQITGFKELLQRMLPHLICLNLNGMEMRGDQVGRKILPLGVGGEDVALLKVIKESGYKGPIGILNHTGEDAEGRLLDNLEGLRWLIPQLDGRAAGPKPTPRTFTQQVPAQPLASVQRQSVSRPTGYPSLNAAFGKALSGHLLMEGKREYRVLPLTVECRAKITDSGEFNILVACDPKASADHWELYTYKGSGCLSLYMPGRGGEFRSNVNVCDGKWHALAAVIGPEKVSLYVDGEMVKEATLRERSGTPSPGGFAIGSLAEGTLRCRGLIDDVRLSSGAREIAAPQQEPLKADARTLGLWNFDDLPATAEEATKDMPVATPCPRVDRSALPPEFVIPAAPLERLSASNGWPASGNRADWERSLGGSTSNRFSELTQITPENVARLEPAWTYRSGDGNGNIQCNPIVVKGVMYTPTPGRHLVALDAANGKELWRFPLKRLLGGQSNTPARRGLLYWKGDEKASARLLFGDGNWLVALDPVSGEPVAQFGDGGKVPVPAGTTAVGAMYGNVLVLPGYSGDVFGFDARDGKLLWTFKTRPGPGEYGHETWSRVEGGANCWGGMALDESRGIAYVSLGSPKPNFIGLNHQGDNLFGNCIVALDALTGRRLWHFQELRHDIWDWDIPAPPNLVTVERYGKRIDAVAQVTKLGNTLLLDRLTGENLYDFRLLRVDTHGLPGDETASYQPAPELPQPFARQAYTRADLPCDAAAKAALLPLFERANAGAFPSFDEARPTLMFNIHGGAEWTGAAADPNGFLYVTSNEIPWSITCFRDDDPAPLSPPTTGEQVYQTNCAVCHGADRKGIGHAPPLRGVRHRLVEGDVRALLKTGRASMPPMAHLNEEQVRALADFILCRDRPVSSAGASGREWTFSGFNRVLDVNGYPACTAPWGTLNCINLNTGKIAWSVPLGEYPELAQAGVPKTGQENFGGAIVTRSGLVFASGTRDKKIRAFDSASGRELWNSDLPLHGTAPPTCYEAGGRQFIVQPATGGGKLGGASGDYWVAFALPQKQVLPAP